LGEGDEKGIPPPSPGPSHGGEGKEEEQPGRGRKTVEPRRGDALAGDEGVLKNTRFTEPGQNEVYET